jgi:hypothetical protein
MEDYSTLNSAVVTANLERNAAASGADAQSPHRNTTSRPATASRSANSIIKEASAYTASSELCLPGIIGTNAKMLSSAISAALHIDVDPSSTTGFEAPNGLYASCRDRNSREKLFVVFKGRQFLAPSSSELTLVLEEAMALMLHKHSVPPSEMIKRFPILARSDLYQGCDRVVIITLVKDHLESSFSSEVPFQFHHRVHFSSMWSHLLHFHFFSLRHFMEAVDADAPTLSHEFRKWLFLFAYQGRLMSTKVDGGERLQRLCDEAVADEAIAMAWEKTAELSRGPHL